MKGLTARECVLLTIIYLIIATNCYGQSERFQISAGTGFEANHFNWSIAGNADGQHPNILSELKFDRINSYGLFGNGSYQVNTALKINVHYQRYKVTSGTGTDVDYAGDNRTAPIFQEAFESDRGRSQMFIVGGQYTLIRSGSFRLAGGIHYMDRSAMYYLLSDRLSALESSYEASYKGGIASLSSEYQVLPAICIGADLGFSLSSYKGIADWNLIDIFQHPVSFAQSAHAKGVTLKLKALYLFTPRLGINVNGIFDHLSIHKGTDISYLKNGTSIATRFNGGSSRSYVANIGMFYRF